MLEHVAARCGEFLLLFPAENVGLIEPIAPGARFRAWVRRDRRSPAEAVLDLRRLLGAKAATSTGLGVKLRWQATDGRRAIGVLVDAVEEIVDCHTGDLIDARTLPARLRPMCEQVMHDPRGTLRLRVKPDVVLPMEKVADRRRFALSLVVADGEGSR